ncbi:MAG TPA: NADH-quinone oxidoreductase subunit L [bacterium]
MAETLLWLIPALPFAAFLLNGLLGRKLTRTAAHWPALLAVGGAFVCAVQVLRHALESPAWRVDFFTWIAVGPFQVPLTLAADPLTAIMLVVVTGVSTLVHLYSVGYMHGDGGYHRFFAYLSLFTFSMLMLVLSGNFLLLYVFWEAVGLCSYLLIGFWFHKQSAADAGKKAFLVNRVGDFGFALGILLLIANTGSVDYQRVFALAPQLPPSTVTWICLLLFVGACGKSAQLPLHVWLPDAMEGPTPVSALIHAATMVTAGVYMVARCNALFALSPTAMQVVAVVGTLTAVMAAAIAFTQSDLKRIMAYSTVSQLGFMFLGLGVGAWIGAIFHLFTHAFFKALLFLGSGSVMHAIGGDCDVSRQGRLFRKIPWTATTFIVGSLALAGIPFFAGFYSKEMILGGAWAGHHYVLFGLGVLTAGGTAFYVTRAVVLVFFGRRDADCLGATPAGDMHDAHDAHGGHGHPPGVHESPWVMLGPLVILAVMSFVAGLPLEHGFTEFLGRALPSAEHGEVEGALFAEGLAIALALGGAFLGWLVYQKGAIDPDRVAASWPRLYALSKNKFYIDELYSAVIVRPLLALARGALRFDLGVIDGIVNGVAEAAQGWGRALARLQTGRLRDYLSWMAIGVAAVLGVLLWR